MGLRANYCLVSEQQARMLLAATEEGIEDIDESVEDEEEETQLDLSIDKMWDILHFILTGFPAEEPPHGDPLSEAIIGTDSLAISEFAALTPPIRVREIAAALEAINAKTAVAGFSMQAGADADLYPDVWNNEDEWDDLKEEITTSLDALIAFYQTAAASQKHVLVTIC